VELELNNELESLLLCDTQRLALVDAASRWTDHTVTEVFLGEQLEGLDGLGALTKWVIAQPKILQRNVRGFKAGAAVKNSCPRGTPVSACHAQQCDLALKVSLLAWDPTARQNVSHAAAWRSRRPAPSQPELPAEHDRLGGADGWHAARAALAAPAPPQQAAEVKRTATTAARQTVMANALALGPVRRRRRKAKEQHAASANGQAGPAQAKPAAVGRQRSRRSASPTAAQGAAVRRSERRAAAKPPRFRSSSPGADQAASRSCSSSDSSEAEGSSDPGSENDYVPSD
jgi:hypothetical protein